jgi:hypothetical protein
VFQGHTDLMLLCAGLMVIAVMGEVTSMKTLAFCYALLLVAMLYMKIMSMALNYERGSLSAKSDSVSKKESLERLGQQYEQAKLDGKTDLVKKIKAIMDRVKYGKK